MHTLRCGLLLSVLSYQLVAFTAVAQNACKYSSTKNGTCKPYAECLEIHGLMLFKNFACKENTYCCPNKNQYLSDDEDVIAERIDDIFKEDLNPSQFGNENAPVPASRQNVGISQLNPNFITISNSIAFSETVVQKYPNINVPRHGNKQINPSINWPEIPVGPVEPGINEWYEEDGYFPQSVNDYVVRNVGPVDPVVPDINNPRDEEDGYFLQSVNDPVVINEGPVDPVVPDINEWREEEDEYFQQSVDSSGVKGHINPTIQRNFISTLTTPKPITTTTEAIPIFDEEFYRRLGLAFGNKYNKYNQQPVVTTENSTEDETVIQIAEEVTTNSSNFMKNLNLTGLYKLSVEKCGFVHRQNDPSESNVEAHFLELPWLALLRYDGETKAVNFSCGGSLITERWVLTAASCIKKTLIGVRLGEYEISDKSKRDCVERSCSEYKEFKISTTVKHPKYKSETGFKDIALIKLMPSVQKSKNIKPICLPTKVEYFNVPYDSTYLTISGWGLNKEGGTKVMKKHAINRSKIQACQQANPKQHVHQSKLCLATVDEEPSTCSGDPGSPVSWIVDHSTRFVTQIGVVPFGMDKCGAADGVVSTYYIESVADSMDWITTVIGEDG